MLVLSRKQGEAVVIADRIRVSVERISGGRVRLGIEAPQQVAVDRGEVWISKHEKIELIAGSAAG